MQLARHLWPAHIGGTGTESGAEELFWRQNSPEGVFVRGGGVIRLFLPSQDRDAINQQARHNRKQHSANWPASQISGAAPAGELFCTCFQQIARESKSWREAGQPWRRPCWAAAV